MKSEVAVLNSGLGRRGDERNLWGWCMHNLNQPFRGWRREDVPYYQQRLNDSKDPIELARYAYVVWCFNREFRYAEQATRYFLEAAKLYVDKGWYLDQYETTAFCFEFSARLSLSLRLRPPLDVLTILTTISEAIAKSVSASINGRGTSDFIDVVASLAEGIHKNKHLRENATVQGIYRTTIQNATTLASRWQAKGERHWQRSYLEYHMRLAKLTDHGEARKMKTAIAESFVDEANSRPSSKIVESIYLESALRIYSELGMSNEARKLMVRIRECQEEADRKGEFKEISVSTDLPVEEVAQQIESKLVDRSPNEILQQVSLDRSFIPKMTKVRETVTQIRENSPLTFLIPVTVSQRDLPAHTLTEENEILEHKTTEQFNIQSQVFEALFASLMARLCRSKLDHKAFTNFLRQSRNISDSGQDIISRGLERHFATDYVSSIHVLIPQIEETLRKILLDRNQTTAKVGVGVDLMQEKLLQGLLEEARDSGTLDDDLVDYLEIRLTQRFANIRNQVCHGWMEPEEFKESLSWALIGMILRLSVVR
jgi:hypothetical protein